MAAETGYRVFFEGGTVTCDRCNQGTMLRWFQWSENVADCESLILLSRESEGGAARTQSALNFDMPRVCQKKARVGLGWINSELRPR